MNLRRAWISLVTVVCSGLLGTTAWSQADASHARTQQKDRARTVMSQVLPALDGGHLKVVLLEIRYAPGEASPPHRHPCAVIGYVVEGSLRTRMQGKPEMIYAAGQSFYEAPNAVHLISANASATEPAKFLAYLICDRDTKLTVDVSEPTSPQGTSR